MGKTECSCLLDVSQVYGKEMATRDAYGITLVELGKKNPNIVVLDADLSCSTKTAKFAKAFPEKFFNIGIAEQDMIGVAAGLALTGKIPFASTFAIFATGRAWEQIRQTVCYSYANVKIVATHGGITVGEDGATHQAVEDIALMRVIPRMSVIVPADAYETAQAIAVAAEYSGPVYIRLGRAKVPSVMPESYKFQIGKSHLFRVGKDVNIIANGIMVSEALKASEILNKEGIDTGVANFSSVKPLDTEALIKIAKSSKLIVTAEEHSIIGGLGSAVAEFVSENYPVAVKRIGIKDTFGCSGSWKELLKFYGLTAENIVQTVKDFFKR
ncbi:transketolase family protein [Thermodesulfovibrio sp. 3907-1M]|uniref:Transketolase family protein n=1 Tax=Thermodesulfovibrio autotrophicus TaxID=3118333 RepID=A0AAU8GWK4_9BACT